MNNLTVEERETLWHDTKRVQAAIVLVKPEQRMQVLTLATLREGRANGLSVEQSISTFVRIAVQHGDDHIEDVKEQ